MQLPQFLDRLGYSNASERFLRADTAAFKHAENFGHIFRHASGKECALRGVYQLQPPAGGGPSVPVVYVCEAKTEAAARRIHRLVWNQDIAPFILVLTANGIRLYSGFEYGCETTAHDEGLLTPLIQFNEIADRLSAFTAEGIDSGEIWRQWGDRVRPQARVYWKLLDSLLELDRWLRDSAKLGEEIRHALIGKYVYLHYLKDRGILSPDRFAEWNIQTETVFGRNATLAGLSAVTKKLDGFLNGRVFPLNFRGPGAPKDEHVQLVASVFNGDEIVGDAAQLHLAFQRYDFSFIPIETISMIYEQFLHLPETTDGDEHSEGRKAGAYYTPIAVVNFMLSELEQHRPLHRGITVFDPSCGSGAFLVQCYRRLIEREFPAGQKKPTPHELRRLLERHIFGVDLDIDACSVAEFSLILTLLDYVDPPDLVKHPRFRLPNLRNQNIFQSDFFDDRLREPGKLGKKRFHWIVGNPPWKRLETKGLEQRDRAAMQWILEHDEDRPVGKFALAQAFTWRSGDFLHAKGEAALLLPAMSLFEDVSVNFRAAFFRSHHVRAVANYSNFARVLFKGRQETPATALFFRHSGKTQENTTTTVYSPLVANQEPSRPLTPGERTESWGITINGSEIRELDFCEISDGCGLPWKLAMWGSQLDANLLGRMKRRWKTIGDLEAPWRRKENKFASSKSHQILGISEGLQLRKNIVGGEALEPIPELRGKCELNVSALARLRNVYAFPADATSLVEEDRAFARKGRATLPLAVCRPPHIVIGAARNYAVFCSEFLVVPARQIGIVSPTANANLLKALALYLSSDFAFYHQFLHSSQQGVKFEVATLESLRQLPCPLDALTDEQLEEWASLHDQLTATEPRHMNQREDEVPDDDQPALVRELNRLTSNALGLNERDQALVHDLVHVRLALNDGKIGPDATREAPAPEMQIYARWLRRELDDFVGQESPRRHLLTVLYDDRSAMVAIEFTPTASSGTPRILKANSTQAATLEGTRRRLRKEHAQWVYFDRALKIFQGRKTFLFKPRQRFHWTRTQAMVDAADIISETLSS